MPGENLVPISRKPVDLTWQRTTKLSELRTQQRDKGLKSKDNEGLWKNVRVAVRGSEIPRKANYCLVPYVSFAFLLKTFLVWAGSAYSLLHVTATVTTRLRLVSGSWRGKGDKPLYYGVVTNTGHQAQGTGWPVSHCSARCRELGNRPWLYIKLMRVLGRAEF